MRVHAREIGAATTLLLVAAMLAAVSAGPVSAGDIVWPSNFCSPTVKAPCVVSATVNGDPVNASHPTWHIEVDRYTGDGSKTAQWNVRRKDTGSYSLGNAALDDAWVIRIDMGAIVPRVSFLRADNAETVRIDNGDGTHRATVKGVPIVLSGECDTSKWPWTCPEVASEEWRGRFGGDITDYAVWEDTAQRNAMYGMDYASNIDSTSVPPQVVNDAGTQYLFLELASPHYRANGTTVIKGFARVRIPNAFLKNTYDIDDPATLTGSGLVSEVSGSSKGAGTVTVSPDGNAMLVDISDMTFSARTVKIKRGTITPTKPKNVRAKRTAVHRGKVTFDKAKARGSKITGYRASCVSRRGSDTETAKADASPIVVRGLMAGVGYDCRVRALSKAGPGKWTATTGMAAHPS